MQFSGLWINWKIERDKSAQSCPGTRREHKHNFTIIWFQMIQMIPEWSERLIVINIWIVSVTWLGMLYVNRHLELWFSIFNFQFLIIRQLGEVSLKSTWLKFKYTRTSIIGRESHALNAAVAASRFEHIRFIRICWLHGGSWVVTIGLVWMVGNFSSRDFDIAWMRCKWWKLPCLSNGNSIRVLCGIDATFIIKQSVLDIKWYLKYICVTYTGIVSFQQSWERFPQKPGTKRKREWEWDGKSE